MQTMHDAARGSATSVQSGSEFFSKLLPEALKDLMSLEHPTSYPSNMILFSEKEVTQGAFVVLEGEVKLSINSSDGRRLILRIAKKGEILGLDSVISGEPSEMTAETLYPCRIAVISRQNFLGFMVRHPEAARSAWHARSCAPLHCLHQRPKNSLASCSTSAAMARRLQPASASASA